jgi:holo-[acyl-carrier protein] synthase
VVDESLQPRFVVQGGVADAVAGLGADQLHLSLSHDGGFALAFVVLESSGR